MSEKKISELRYQEHKCKKYVSLSIRRAENKYLSLRQESHRLWLQMSKRDSKKTLRVLVNEQFERIYENNFTGTKFPHQSILHD